MVLLLATDLAVLAQTPDTERYLRLLVPPPGDRAPIPAGAFNVAAQLLAVEAGIDAHPPSARVHLSEGVWVTLRAARLGGADGDGDIAVTIEDTSPDQRVSLFAKSSALSPRESEVLGHLVSGSDTRQLAERLYISEHTVQDHFKSIFAKTGARTRASLLSKVLGNGPSHGGANVG
jgi:DNA-binding CsgD family transcriptional regulator